MRSPHWRRSAVGGVMVAVALAGSAGCLTETAWREASATTCDFETVGGTDVGPAGRRSLVAVYGDGTIDVPLRTDGSSAEPFALTTPGPLHRFHVVERVPATQTTAILARAGQVRSVGAFQPAAAVPAAAGHGWAGDWVVDADPPADLIAVAYRVGAGGRVEPAEVAADGTVSPAAFVVLLPDSQPRPAAARSAARIETAALTPLTLAFDAVGTPLIWLAVLDGKFNVWLGTDRDSDAARR